MGLFDEALARERQQHAAEWRAAAQANEEEARNAAARIGEARQAAEALLGDVNDAVDALRRLAPRLHYKNDRGSVSTVDAGSGRSRGRISNWQVVVNVPGQRRYRAATIVVPTMAPVEVRPTGLPPQAMSLTEFAHGGTCAWFESDGDFSGSVGEIGADVVFETSIAVLAAAIAASQVSGSDTASPQSQQVTNSAGLQGQIDRLEAKVAKKRARRDRLSEKISASSTKGPAGWIRNQRSETLKNLDYRLKRWESKLNAARHKRGY